MRRGAAKVLQLLYCRDVAAQVPVLRHRRVLAWVRRRAAGDGFRVFRMTSGFSG